MRRLSRAALLSLVLLASACDSGDGPTAGDAYYDLVTKLGSASVEGETPAIVPMAKHEEELLLLPAGAEADYLLFADPESTLRADGVILRGAGARLEISLETDNDGKRELARLRRSREGLAVPLRLKSRTAIRLSLRSVANDGELLPDKERIFELFVSMRDAEHKDKENLGLGLYVVKLIAESHGGTVRAEDLPDDNGALFTITLPILQNLRS